MKEKIQLPSYIEPSTSAMTEEYARANLEDFCQRAAQVVRLIDNRETEHESFDSFMRGFWEAQNLTHGKPFNS